MTAPSLIFYAPEAAFVEPYVRAALGKVDIVDSVSDEARLAVMLSSTDIYGDSPLDCAGEDAAVGGIWADHEKEFIERTKGVPQLILRCPDIIGTGMTGFPRRLAVAVWRGTFFHLPGNDARRSAVHAVDIAEIVRRALIGLPHAGTNIYNISDGVHPAVDALADALAYRMSDKRVSTLSTRPQQWFGRLVYGRRLTAEYTTTRIVDSSALERDFAFTPTDVCGYLRTHVYDETSL